MGQKFIYSIDYANVKNVIKYKGAIDCSSNPNYPAANAGHAYIVSVTGKIGGVSGLTVAAGDLLLCKTDGTASGDHATVGENWNVLEKNIDLGNIKISGGSIDGTLIGNTTPAPGTFTTLTATNGAEISGNITVTGTVDGRDVSVDGTKLDGVEQLFMLQQV